MQQKSMLDAMPSEQDLAFMLELIKVMRDAGVVNKSGGPFGAVIVKDGELIAAAGNRVIQTTTPVPLQRCMRFARPADRSTTGISAAA